MLQPLAIFELTQFVGDADQYVGIRADAEPAARVKEFAGRKNAVAEARLGNRAEPGDRAAPGERGDFSRGHMGRMDQAPAPIEGRMFEQPLNRPPARPGDAFLDFPDLFGGVDMHRPAFGQRHDGRQFVRRHRPQAVRRDTDIGSGQRSTAARAAAMSLANWSIEQMNRRWPACGAAPPNELCA